MQNGTPTPDNKIAWLSIAGVAGFIFGCFILFPGEFSRGGPPSEFHEIVYSPKQLSLQAVEAGIDRYRQEVAYTQRQLDTTVLKKGDTAKIKLTALLKKKKDSDSGIITKLTQYKELFEDSGHIDSEAFNIMNKAMHFHITLEDLALWDSAFAEDGFAWKSPKVGDFLKDKAIPFTIADSVVFSASPASSNIAFITRYPVTGVWIILVLSFCSFCVAAIVSAVYLKNKTDDLLPSTNASKKPWKDQYLLTIIFVFLSICGLLFFCRITFYDKTIVKDLYFMRNHDSFTLLLTIMGTIAGAFCLAGFVYTSSMLSFVARPVIEARKEVAVAMAANENSTALLNAQKKEAEKTLDWKKLFGIFNTYFILASIILSLMVLCTGTLYSLINSLDFIRLITDDWGYSPVRTDFVYLCGGLYTLVLLLVYIPARMRFAETDIPDLKPAPPESAKWYEFLKNPFRHFTGVLAAASPLMVSFVQSLIDLLFK